MHATIQVLYSHSIPIPPFPELDEGTLFQDPTWYKQWFSASRFPSTSPLNGIPIRSPFNFVLPPVFSSLRNPIESVACIYIYIYTYIYIIRMYIYIYIGMYICIYKIHVPVYTGVCVCHKP